MSRLMGGGQGNGTGADASAPGPVAPGSVPQSSALPNPVLKFLHSREEPKAVDMKASQHRQPHSNVDLRKMHQAGGYDINLYEQRNWAEVQYHLTGAQPHPA